MEQSGVARLSVLALHAPLMSRQTLICELSIVICATGLCLFNDTLKRGFWDQSVIDKNHGCVGALTSAVTGSCFHAKYVKFF